MIIEEIKNSIRDALNKADNNIIFHFEEVKHTGFPFVILNITGFNIMPLSNKKECNFSFEIRYMKSENNKNSELLEAQTLLSKALLPTIEIIGKKLTLDNVSFSMSDKELLMKFNLSFYLFENEEGDTMQTLDITIKEK